MHIGKSYRLSAFLFWTRRKIYTLIVLGTTPVVVYHLFGMKWLTVEWRGKPIANGLYHPFRNEMADSTRRVVSLLGTATAFIAGTISLYKPV